MHENLILVGTAGLVGWILAGWQWLHRPRRLLSVVKDAIPVRQSDRLWDGRTGPIGYNQPAPGAKAPEGPLSAITGGKSGHPFEPGDPEWGWEQQCSHVVSSYGVDRHCGAPPEAHRR